MTFVGRDFLGNLGFSAGAVYLSDMDKCTPSDAIGRDSRRGRWHAYDYETEGFDGVVLMAGPETQAPDITYPLDVKGWHAISIGIHPTDHGQSERSGFLARLSGDETYVEFTWEPEHGHLKRQRLEEMFWKTADLTDQQIHFRQYQKRRAAGEIPGTVACGAARIAYIKLVRLTPAETEGLGAVSTDRRLFAHTDTDWAMAKGTEHGIKSVLAPYRDTDFSRMYWEMGSGDLLSYNTDIGRKKHSVVVPDYARAWDRQRDEGARNLVEEGVDLFQVALDHTHDIGMEFHASYRLAGWTYPPPLLDYQWVGGFYESHPEWHCIDREGRNVPRMSYAYEEVQDYALSVLREVATKYDVEGVSLLYNRRPPYVDHEEPLIEGFKSIHGRDPRDLDEREPRWLKYKADVLTGFMRRVRSEMDAVGRERGKRVDITACVLGKEEDNMYFAMDIPSWVEEGLIDTLIPYSPAPLAMPVATDTWATADQIAPFVDVVKGTSVVMAPNIMPRQMSPEDFRRNASMLYGAGAENLFFWDCNGRCTYKPSWNALRRLGHRDEIEAWKADGEADLGAPLVPLRTLGGWHMGAIAPG